MNTGLAKIAQGHLNTRIAPAGPEDDLSLLAKRINVTAERLEDAMAQMRVQSSNIAPDLRTPLARLAGVKVGRVGWCLCRQRRPLVAAARLDGISRTPLSCKRPDPNSFRSALTDSGRQNPTMKAEFRANVPWPRSRSAPRPRSDR
ncbi:MAG: hypothetical protein JJ920_01390 [Roseitalea sp.]|nr:hypothetical protein [Roseitalea sp.]MBO6722681.1 hypothetical protein [Roseitalea sp.]MBO6741535.1 hypothetical protein [Roseitalea sp.]